MAAAHNFDVPAGYTVRVRIIDTTSQIEMRIRKASFGSVAIGRKIQEAAAKSTLKRVTLELGGKSPAVIFENANLENALTWTINAILTGSGQLCVAASRVAHWSCQLGLRSPFPPSLRMIVPRQYVYRLSMWNPVKWA
ncbi:hypothetical protein AYO21_09130 [Fonsecaea monophora]|uniref:aldehyde dehydrogenase (NAD(+)) n=1 Tax=Fonsecaea monophora TaxID=254056 RepID=A0A177EX92_9EURO|nr:hypothetical protein AYO21_09130 [Fonsecaea monophora]OAG36655.1 hypothetical protein AYO21_09130 [Fonsecaea monophora]